MYRKSMIASSFPAPVTLRPSQRLSTLRETNEGMKQLQITPLTENDHAPPPIEPGTTYQCVKVTSRDGYPTPKTMRGCRSKAWLFVCLPKCMARLSNGVVRAVFHYLLWSARAQDRLVREESWHSIAAHSAGTTGQTLKNANSGGRPTRMTP